MGFSVLYRLPLRFFLLRVPVGFRGWFGRSFKLTLLRCCVSSFPIFRRFQPSFCSFVSFVVPPPILGSCIACFVSFSWVLRLPFLVLFLFIRRLCLSSALVAWCVFRLLFSYFIVRSLRPSLLSSSVMFFFSVLSSRSGSFVSFFVPVQPFPVFVFHTSSSILLRGYSFVRAFRACVVFVFVCIGALFGLPGSPSPPRGLSSAFPASCSVLLAVLRCPVVPLSSPFRLLLSLPPLPFLSGFGFGSGFFSFGFLVGILSSTCSLFGSFASGSRWCPVAGLCTFFCCSFAPTFVLFRLRRVTLLSWVGFLLALLPLPPLCAMFLVFFQPVWCRVFFHRPSWCFSILCSLFPCEFSAFDSLRWDCPAAFFPRSAFSVPIFPLLFRPPLVSPPSCLQSAFAQMSGVSWCILSALCFIQSGVTILLLLFPLALLSFVSFFVGLLGLLWLRWFLLRCLFLRDFGLLLCRFLCSGSAGLSYHSFPHPSFLLASFVLSPLFSSGRFCGCLFRL